MSQTTYYDTQSIIYIMSLNTEICHDVNFVVNGGTLGHHNENSDSTMIFTLSV